MTAQGVGQMGVSPCGWARWGWGRGDVGVRGLAVRVVPDGRGAAWGSSAQSRVGGERNGFPLNELRRLMHQRQRL